MVDALLEAVARSMLHRVKETPTIARTMLTAIDQDDTPLALKVGLASVLAYLVQPRDLISDDLPGGYGLHR